MERFPSWLKGVLLLAVLAALAGGAWFYRAQERQHRRQVENELTAIARLKADQIAAWRRERLDEGAALVERPLLTEHLIQWLVHPQPGVREELLTEFRVLQRHDDYSDVMLVDTDGHIRLSLSGSSGAAPVPALTALAAAWRDRRPVFIDLHVDAVDAGPHTGVAAPLFSGKAKDARPLGAIILISDARQFLYPLIQSWPVPSGSAETLLVRRDGEEVLFLNDLRHQPDTALRLRIPLSRTDVPAVMAILGRQGIVAGRDYRGIEVLSAILPVPDSPWFMVAKMDAAEAYSALRRESVFILALLLALTALAGISVFVVWQRNQKAHYRTLYRSEARHGITLNSIGDAVIATDAEGKIEHINPVAAALTGWGDAEAHGRPLQDVFRIINEESRRPVENPAAKVLREGTVVGLANHTLLIAKDGKEIPIADSGAPIRDENDEIVGVVLVFRDQTEERLAIRMTQTRSALVEYAATHTLAELMTRALDEIGELTASPIGFFHLLESDQKTLSLQQWSTCTLTQFCRAEVNGRHLSIEQAGVWADCARERRPIIHNDYEALKHKLEMPDGHPKVIRELLIPVMRENKIVAILGVGNKRADYTEKDAATASYLSDVVWEIVNRKRAEEAWQDSEKRYRRLFESAKDGILILNADTGKVVDVNPFLIDLLGFSREELLDKEIWELGSFKNMAENKDKFVELQQQQYVRYDNLPLETRDGRHVAVEFVSNVYLVDHTRVVQCNIRDNTERKRAEEDRERLEAQLQQAQKLESVGRLAGGVAHDFNNLLSVILGYGELVIMDLQAGHPHHEPLTEILAAAVRAKNLTRQLLAFSRKQVLEMHPLDANSVVIGFEKFLRRIIGEDIELNLALSSAPLRIRADTAQLEQVLMNLAVNARDAMPAGGVMTVKTAAIELDEAYCAGKPGITPGIYACISVSDTGTGMDKETLGHLFEPFFTTKTKDKGTGLGLATSYGIVKQHGGNIWVYSEPGEGTTFKVYLPLGTETAAATPPADPGPRREPLLGEATVLVVEDDRALRKMAAGILRQGGYEVLESESAANAVEQAKMHTGPIHLVLTDVVMPEMKGPEVYDRIRRHHPEARVLYMSGYTDNVIVHHGVLEEGIAFIQKPFTVNGLLEKVAEVLGEG